MSQGPKFGLSVPIHGGKCYHTFSDSLGLN